MALQNPLVIIGAGTLAGAISVIVVNVIRARRAERRQARRDQLCSLARRNGLDYAGERVRAEDVDSAAWFRGETRKAKADGFLVGQDRSGRYWMARRQVDDETQEVLGFQVRGDLKMGHVLLEPQVSDASGAGTSWAKRLFSGRGTTTPPVVRRWTVQRWASPDQMVDEHARNSVDRWVDLLVVRGKTEGRVPVGLEVADGEGWIFSTRPLEGSRLQDFLELALDLRGAVLQEVQRRPATVSAPVRTVSAAEERQEREDTAPLFAVEVSEGADLDGESKTVVLSAQDLLREVPDPRRKPKPKGFQIPEPEEEVQVIWTRQG